MKNIAGRTSACIFVLFFFIILPIHSLHAQFYYGLTQTYGKSRPVYNRFQWNYMRFPSYDVFYYKNGANNARYIASILPEETENINRYFGGTIDTRIQIFCYNSLTDLKQSNILGTSDEKYDLSGITQAMGYNIFIYGTGSHTDLRSQLRAALMEVYLNYMVGGGAKNGETIHDIGLSAWFTKGLTAYYGTPNITAEMLQVIKEQHAAGRFRSMKTYDNALAATLGYSIWYYLHSRYGEQTAARIIMSSISHENENSGIKEIIGIPAAQITKDWTEYYGRLFSDDGFAANGTKKKNTVPVNAISRSKYTSRIDAFSSHPSMGAEAYAVGEDGLYRIYIKDSHNGKRTKLLTGGYRIPQNRDASIPVLSWAGENKKTLAVATEQHGDIYLRMYDTERKRKKEISSHRLSQVDKVLSMDFSPDGSRAVLSAVRNGYSDLYLYSPSSGALTPLTSDSYDDFSPRFFPDGHRIAFTSTRIIDTLHRSISHTVAGDETDIFVYDLNDESGVLKRLSSSVRINEFFPIPMDSSSVMYAHDLRSSLQLSMAVADSVVSHVDTTVHFRHRVRHYDVSNTSHPVIKNDKGSYLTYRKNKYFLLPMERMEVSEEESAPKSKPAETPSPSYSQYPINIYNYRFEPSLYAKYSTSGIIPSRNPYREETVNVSDTVLTVRNIDEAYLEKFKRMYRKTYFPTTVSAHISNAFLNTDYQPFTGGPVSPPSTFGGTVNLGISDLMRDFTFLIGLNTDFSSVSGYSLLANSELSFGIYNDRHRLKYGASYYRRSMVQEDYSYILAYITSMVKGHVSYPFSPVSTLTGTMGVRRDSYRYLSTDMENLLRPTTHRDYISLNVAYTYDNSTYFDMNLHRGFRAKVFAEVYQGLYSSPVSRTMINVGVDARHYLRVHKNIIWASRLAYGASLGGLKLLYYLGGVDNQFNPSFSTENPASSSYNWGFQTLATNMRGFPQNARYGDNFMVLNNELRIPLFQYLSRNTIRINLIRHFQIVPFVDVGAAWTASTPWAADNEYNRKTITQGDITIILNRSLDPFLVGYGVGLRTCFLGYFIRADWAWGHDSGLKVPSRFYLSLGFDF